MKKFFSLLIAACSAFLVALIPASKASAAEDTSLRTFPTAEEMAAESFELNGVKYTKSQNGYNGIYVDEPQSVETLVLLGNIGDQRVFYYDGPLFEAYTNVEDVIVLNHYFDDTIEMLKSIPQAFDLYVGGRLAFNYGFEDINVNNLYICNPYAVNTDMMFSSYMLEHTVGSPIYTINYLDYVPAFEEVANTYNAGTTKITNVDGKVLDLTKVSSEDCKYPMEVFYPYEDFSYTPPFLGCEGYAYHDGYGELTDPKRQLTYVITGVDKKLDTLYYDWHYENDSFKALPDTLVLASYNGDSISQADGKNIVAFNNGDSFSIVDFRFFETIRFYPADENGGTVITDYTSHQGFAGGMTVYLPTEYMDTHFADIKNDTNILSLELYSLNDYEKPIYSKFKSDNGSIYKVADQTLSINDIESDIAECETNGAVFSTETPIDLQIRQFRETGSTGNPDVNNPTEPDTNNPTTPDVDDNVVYEDETEWIEGYKSAGSIMYYGDYDIEDILNIASKYILWQDGTMLTEGYEVEYEITVNNRLNTTIYKDGQRVANLEAPIEKLESSTVGDFIYLGMHQGRGALIIDKNNQTPLDQIADYVLRHYTNVESIGKITAEDSKVSGYFKHVNAQNQLVIDMNVISTDLSKIDDADNATIEYETYICPDDNIEDPESEYNVKTIKAIYIPKNMSAINIPSVISEVIVTYNGGINGTVVPFGSSHGFIDNQNEYSFTMIGMLPNNIKYKHEVPVKLLTTTERVAYVLLDDDTVIVVTLHNAVESNEQLTALANAFLKDTIGVANPNITLSEEVNLNATGTYYGSTFSGNNELVVVNSGVAALNFSTAANPVDESQLYDFYQVMSNIYYTDNYSLEEVVKLIGKHIVMYNGIQVNSGYKLDAVISKDTITFSVYLKDTLVTRIITKPHVVKNSEVGPFIYAGLGHKSVIVVEQDKETTTKIQDLYEYVLTNVAGAKEVHTINTSLTYTELGSDRFYEVYEHINDNFYNYQTTIVVTTFEEETKETEADKHVVISTEKPSIMDEIKDKVDEWTDSFKDKFENNQAFKTVSIILGSLLGVFLLLGIYKIFKKLFRWLGR